MSQEADGVLRPTLHGAPLRTETSYKVSSSSSEGPCPVCHKPSSACQRWWSVRPDEPGEWKGILYVICKGFLDDHEALAESLNRYHIRPTSGEEDGHA